MSDHTKIDKLLLEVAELQKNLAALTQKYDTHAHPLQPEVAQLPGAIECNQSVARWTPPGSNRDFVQKVCRQMISGNISVLVAPGKESVATRGRPSILAKYPEAYWRRVVGFLQQYSPLTLVEIG